MNSGGHRFFTVVTIVTLIFAPVFSHHHWVYRLVSTTAETHTVPCLAHTPCPASQVIVKVIAPPLPQDPPRGGGNHEEDQTGQNGQNQAQAQAGLTTALAP